MFARAGQPCDCAVMLYVGEGSKKDECHLFSSLPAVSPFPHYPQSNRALLVLIPGWVGLCTFEDPVGLSNELPCEAGSFSCCCLNPYRFLQSEVLRLYFPMLGPWIVWSVSSPSGSSRFICT